MLAVRDTDTFCERLLEDTGIMLVPSSMFDYGKNHVRIGFGREDLAEAVERFSSYINRRFR